jgi:dipeptidase D
MTNSTDHPIFTQEPKDVWKHFYTLCQIPRPSKKEDKIISYLKQLADNHGLSWVTDQVGNLVVHVPSKNGKDESHGLVIQGHVDMVCEQNRGRNHDFDNDGLELLIDGEWLRARDTTLGADNGIGVAFMMALMEGSYDHGPLDLLFTIDEETGLTGAIDLDPSILRYKTLINLDTEEEGDFCIGCAGGKETIGVLSLQRDLKSEQQVYKEISVQGLRGGHSGADIHMELGNANCLLARILWSIFQTLPFSICSVSGGDKHNAIPREAYAIIAIPKDSEDQYNKSIESMISDLHQVFLSELGEWDQQLKLSFENTHLSEGFLPISQSQSKTLIQAMLNLPHGVYGMSRTIPGLVSTSTNFAAIKTNTSSVTILTSQRSDQQSQRDWIADKTGSCLSALGFEVSFTRQYPGWKPNPNSALLKESMRIYPSVSGKEAIIRSIHAGLECGVIGDKIPGMDMISFGPDIEAPHTPGERVRIKSVERTWKFFLELIRMI